MHAAAPATHLEPITLGPAKDTGLAHGNANHRATNIHIECAYTRIECIISGFDLDYATSYFSDYNEIEFFSIAFANARKKTKHIILL
jgi:hypothetical protein